MDIRTIAAHIISQLQLPRARWATPVLIALFGVPGAGKTEVARALAERHPVLVLSTDALRLDYGFESGLATRQVMDQIAAQMLPQHISMVFDGIHLGRKDRLAVEQLAHSYNAQARLLYVVADPLVIERRLAARIERPAMVAAERKFVITPEHFARIVQYLEPPMAEEAVLTIDTSGDRVGDQLDQLSMDLERWLHGSEHAVE